MIFSLDHVTKRYGSHTALNDVSVDVQPGSIGLLGPNGAGKSTLIKVLLGLVETTSGRAEVLGVDTQSDALSIRSRIGYMPEDDCYIAGLKGVEMVARTAELAGLSPSSALRRAHEVLDYVRLGEARYREVQQFSTGMKQRVRFATALVHAPELVLLDEPTSGMDPDGREQMLKLVQDLRREHGISVVMSTHILHDVERCCDAVLILGGGEKLVYDSLESLQNTIDTRIVTRIEGDVEAFQNAVRAKGGTVQPTRTRGFLEVSIPETTDGSAAELILHCARASSAHIREVQPAKNSLEEIFLRALRVGTESSNVEGEPLAHP